MIKHDKDKLEVKHKTQAAIDKEKEIKNQEIYDKKIKDKEARRQEVKDKQEKVYDSEERRYVRAERVQEMKNEGWAVIDTDYVDATTNAANRAISNQQKDLVLMENKNYKKSHKDHKSEDLKDEDRKHKDNEEHEVLYKDRHKKV